MCVCVHIHTQGHIPERRYNEHVCIRRRGIAARSHILSLKSFKYVFNVNLDILSISLAHYYL